eukprot:TRINITY_DN4770_c0_g1_i6.p1 TRINITY_DN4770_c0_g1~~TRINITY_DN4770_c0_g1_i6.p1  ORF type:complete len:289 (-),score=24.27 TRINITY_DN4770_c0_g1_i6:44-910(-)
MGDIPFCINNAFFDTTNINGSSQCCAGQFPSILQKTQQIHDEWICNDFYQIPGNEGIYSIEDQLSPILLIPVTLACLVLILVTLPCDWKWKTMLERIVSKLDLYPTKKLEINEELSPLNALHSSHNSDGSSTSLQYRESRSVIGGWLMLFLLLIFISTVCFLSLEYSDPRSITLTPYLKSSEGRLVFQSLKHLVHLQFQAVLKCSSPKDCIDSNDCTSKIGLEGDFLPKTYTCTTFRSKDNSSLYFHVVWESPPIVLSEVVNFNTSYPSQILNLTYTMKEIGEIRAYL